MMHTLKHYSTHETVEQLNRSVATHIQQAKLKGNERKVLYCLAKHALQYPGVCCLKAITIAAEVGISRATVTRTVKSLREKRVITSHNTTKKNGILGANIYCILCPIETNEAVHVGKTTNAQHASFFEPSSEPTNEAAEMSQRENVENARHTTSRNENKRSVSFSFNQSLSNVEQQQYVYYVQHTSIRAILKSIYEPTVQQESAAFQELCKIAFGRLKQGLRMYHIPYTQMRDIVIRCMQQLVQKLDVRNEFALYSAMIERQMKQLFEQPITAPKSGRTERLPDWFATRHEKPQAPALSEADEAQLEEARRRVREKLSML